MHRRVATMLLVLLVLCSVACAEFQPLEDPPVVAPSVTSSLPPSDPAPQVPTATAAPPTSTAPPEPTPTPEPTVAALSVERAVPGMIDSAREITPEQWSPSGRYLSYAVPIDESSLLTSGEPAQVKLLDTATNLICAVPTDGESDLFLPQHLWLAGDRLVFRHAEGYLAVWNTPCEGAPEPVPGATPSLVRGVAPSPNQSRWLTLSEDDLWLFDGDSLQFQPVEGVAYGVHPAASWSPDGNHLVLVQQGAAYRIDPSTGHATELASWDYQPEAGSENFPGSPPQWIDNDRFLVPTVPFGSPQLVGLDGNRVDVSVAYFGLEPMAEEGFPRAAFLLSGEGGGWHILLALYGDGGGPQYQLYHNETATIELLTLPSDTGIFNFVDLVDGGTQILFNEIGTTDMPSYLLRPVDPIGSGWTMLAEGSFRATVAPDGQHVAIGNAEGVTVYGTDGEAVASWALGAEGAWLLWSPLGNQLVTTTLGDAGQQLYLLHLDQL